jgi:multisubunit Na+/H+ antiporter MnhC subunit
VADPVKDSPEVKARLVRAMIPTLVVYAVLAGVGLYLLVTDRVLPGIGFLLGAHAVGLIFHLWARRVRSEYPVQSEAWK